MRMHFVTIKHLLGIKWYILEIPSVIKFAHMRVRSWEGLQVGSCYQSEIYIFFRFMKYFLFHFDVFHVKWCCLELCAIGLKGYIICIIFSVSFPLNSRLYKLILSNTLFSSRFITIGKRRYALKIIWKRREISSLEKNESARNVYLKSVLYFWGLKGYIICGAITEIFYSSQIRSWF